MGVVSIESFRETGPGCCWWTAGPAVVIYPMSPSLEILLLEYKELAGEHYLVVVSDPKTFVDSMVKSNLFDLLYM